MKKSTIFCFLLMCLPFALQAQYAAEFFEDGALPSGWSVESAASDGGFIVGSSTDVSSAAFAVPERTGVIATNDDGCNCDKNQEYLNLPTMDIGSYDGTVTISFDFFFFNGDYQGNNEQAFVEYKTSGSGEWVAEELVTAANNTSWVNGYTIELSGLSGQTLDIRFKYTDGTGWNYGLALDNVTVYGELLAVDLSLLNASLPELAVVGGQGASISVINVGSSNITSFDLEYSVNGGETIVQSEDGFNVNMETFESFTFELDEDIPVPAEGPYEVEFMLTNINGGDDDNVDNNSANASFFAVGEIPEKFVLLEEATGTWCGWCPRGHVFNEYMEDNYENAIIVAVHNDDPMEDAEWDATIGNYIGGYPSGVADRALEVDPADFEPVFLNRIANDVPIASVGVVSGWDADSRQITIQVSSEFILDRSTEYRMNAMIVEMEVTGTSSGYNQVNYYSGGGAGALSGGGVDYAAGGDPIPAGQMIYDHVGRKILGTAWGKDCSLPDAIEKNEEYTYEFAYTLPAGYDENHIRVIGCVQKYDDAISNRNVINSFQADLRLDQSIFAVSAFDLDQDNNDEFNIEVTDQSVNAAEYSWDFGDGSDPISGEGPHDYTYESSGNYVVTLTITDENGEVSSSCNRVFVPGPPVGNLSVSQVDGNSSNVSIDANVDFNSTDPDETIIDLGDGSDPVSGNISSYTYSENGTYTITYTISNQYGESVYTEEVVVAEVPSGTLDVVQSTETTADVSVSTTEAFGEDFAINFGDGSETISGEIPTDYSYTANGDYTITYIMTNEFGTTEVTQTVTVAEAPTADFEMVQDGNSVSVTDMSLFATLWAWSFGDDSDPVDVQAPEEHTYEFNGEYQLCLVAKNTVGQNQACKTVSITNATNVGISELTSINSLEVFPVPAVNEVTIRFNVLENDNFNVEILNIVGQRVALVSNSELTVGEQQIKVDTGNFANGVYFVKINSNDKSSNQRFVISK